MFRNLLNASGLTGKNPSQPAKSSRKNVQVAGYNGSDSTQIARERKNASSNFPAPPASGDEQQCMRMDISETSPLTELVRQAQQGREDAQRSLILNYQQRVAGFVYAITGRSESVEDLAQTVFIKMIRSLPRLDQPAQFEAWLFRLARNACIDYLRRQRWQKLLSPLTAEDHAEIPDTPASVDLEELDTLRHALGQLKPQDRALLALAQEGHTQVEMAESVGISVVALKARLHRARELLRHHYEHAT
jgi:RNA polymerase sigma-70 factor (ECF subfamily)